MAKLELLHNVLGIPTLKPIKNKDRFIKKQIDGCLLDSNRNLVSLAVHHKQIGDRILPRQVFSKPLKQSIQKIIVNESAYYGGIYFNHFGHFCLETLSRLWFYKNLKESKYKVFFHKWGPGKRYTLLKWAIDILELLDIKEENIVFIEKKIFFKEIIVPEQIIGIGKMLKSSPEFINGITEVIDQKINSDCLFLNYEKVYVSRTKLDITQGRFTAESALEEILTDNGFFIFHPQEYSFQEQLAIYKQAKILIFAEGSAAHTLIFLKDLKSEIFLINRRKYSLYTLQQTHEFHSNYNEVNFIKGILRIKQFPASRTMGILDYNELLKLLIEKDIIKKGQNYENILQMSLFKDIVDYLKKISSSNTKQFINSFDILQEELTNCQELLGKSYLQIENIVGELINLKKM